MDKLKKKRKQKMTNYNRKPKGTMPEELPEFDVYVSPSTSAGRERLFDDFPDSRPYREYLHQLKSPAFSQLLSDHRKNYYCMYDMIDSGQVDKYGCFIPEVMKSIRPQVEKIEK